MGECKLIKKVVVVDEDTKFTNLYLRFEGIERDIQIKCAFKDSKSDFVLLTNLAEKIK